MFSDLFCAGRIPEDDINRVMTTCGGTILTTVSNVTDDVLGKCELFYEEQVGSERLVEFCTSLQFIKLCRLDSTSLKAALRLTHAR